MPIDFLGPGEKTLPSAVSEVRVKPYKSRLEALGEAERIHEMITTAAYAMDRSVPNDILAMADRVWFCEARPFRAARDAFKHIKDDLERWEQELEAERSRLAQIYVGRIYAFLQEFESFPERGTVRASVRDGLRIVGLERRVSVAFVVEDTEVIVVRILYAGRGLAPGEE